MDLTLAITERIPGVPLTEGTVPNTPTASPVTGTNQISVGWSKASGQTPREQIELRIDANGQGEQLRSILIDWGDGSGVETITALGKLVTKFRTHTYTGSGPFTITVSVTRFASDLLLLETLEVTPNLSGDWAIHQVQIEKLESDVLRFAPDWAEPLRVPTTIQDVRVSRGYQYKFRVRFRTVGERGAAAVTSRFSLQTLVQPWA